MIHTSYTYVESLRQMSEETAQLKMYTPLLESRNPVGRCGTWAAVFLFPLHDIQYHLTSKTMGMSNTLLKKLKQEAKGFLFVLLFLQSLPPIVLKQPMNISAGGMLAECAMGNLGMVIWFFSGPASLACIPYSHRGPAFALMFRHHYFENLSDLGTKGPIFSFCTVLQIV